MHGGPEGSAAPVRDAPAAVQWQKRKAVSGASDHARQPAGHHSPTEPTLPHSSPASDTPTNPPRLDPRSRATIPRLGAHCRPTLAPSAGRWHRARAPTPAGHSTDFSELVRALQGSSKETKNASMLTCDELAKAHLLSSPADAGLAAVTALRRRALKRPKKCHLAQEAHSDQALPCTAVASNAPVDGYGGASQPTDTGGGAGRSRRAPRPAPYSSLRGAKIRRSSRNVGVSHSSRTNALWRHPQQQQPWPDAG